MLYSSFLNAAELPQPDPVQYRENNQNRDILQNFNGEFSAWHAAYIAEDFLDAYEAYRNVKWLEEAEKYYDFLVSKLEKDPDGYEGWIGQTINKTAGIRSDALVGDAILLAPMVRFAEIVRKDPQLQGRFGTKADRYVKLARRIIWEKWNHRGSYYEDAGYGGYHTPAKYIDAKTGKWVDRPSMVISDNLNKHYMAGKVILRLWRIDPRPEYKERVIKIFSRAKAMWRYYKEEDSRATAMWRYYKEVDRVVWNFWMPQGPYDIEGKAPKSWVAVHPSGAGYQASEVENWVEVYDSGLVFEKQDLERIIRTNHWMAVNGPKGKDGFTSADGTSKAGTLWSALARFDERIRKTHEERLKRALDRPKNQIAYAYLRNVTAKRLGWQRLHVADETKVEVSRPPLLDGRHIVLALVIPSTVETINGSKVKFVTKTRKAGQLKIELLDKSGKTLLGELWSGEMPEKDEYSAPKWDGTNPKTGKKDFGQYLVRWSLAGETRTWPVWVEKGIKRKRTAPDPMQPDEFVEDTFEGKLNSRWKLEGAVVSSEQFHGGQYSLKLINGAKAEFVIGEEDDLPVRITMWIYDGGKNFGKKTMNGPMWGIKTAGGDKFVIRTAWRRYLNGDKDYVWINSGENQFFTVHPAGTGRFKGWSQWVFDFSQANRVTVTGNGKPVKRLTGKYTPKGALAVYLAGGATQVGPLYVDDVKVEHGKK